jgi:putative Mg2+ transporter-C (MgtC) family protein
MLAAFDWLRFEDDLTRLAVAAFMGGVLGFERQLHGHWAGLRTHMMVALGSAVFVLTAARLAGNEAGAVSRAVQGIAAGIGFLGAGTILKLGDKQEIKGLTTASSIWLAAAVGIAAGMAEYALAAAAMGVSLVVLVVLRPLDRRLNERYHNHERHDPSGPNGPG